MPQNTTSAVMQQRHEDADSLDDFPTPPWATRALLEHVLFRGNPSADRMIASHSCLEPACGRGHMLRTLGEYFGEMGGSDIHDYGHGAANRIVGYLDPAYQPETDWTITNPPFNLAEGFIRKALELSRFGVAMLVRSAFLEGVGRYQYLYSRTPPTMIAQFVERVPMQRGKLARKGKTATAYSWLVWVKGAQHGTTPGMAPFMWIPPCRKQLEMDADYFWSGE